VVTSGGRITGSRQTSQLLEGAKPESDQRIAEQPKERGADCEY